MASWFRAPMRLPAACSATGRDFQSRDFHWYSTVWLVETSAKSGVRRSSTSMKFPSSWVTSTNYSAHGSQGFSRSRLASYHLTASRSLWTHFFLGFIQLQMQPFARQFCSYSVKGHTHHRSLCQQFYRTIRKQVNSLPNRCNWFKCHGSTVINSSNIITVTSVLKFSVIMYYTELSVRVPGCQKLQMTP